MKEDAVVSETVQTEASSISSTSKLPCDVLEDAVFPTGSTCSANMTAPSDFSQIRNMIRSSKKDSQSTSSSNQPTVAHQNTKWTR